MVKIWNAVAMVVTRTTGPASFGRAPLLALIWVLSNVVVGWIGIAAGHPNLGALVAGALDGAIFSGIVLGKASVRIEAGMTGFLSGFGLDSITNSGKAVAGFVRGLHEVLETIFNAATSQTAAAKSIENDMHHNLELIVMRAIWMAVIVMLLTLLVKWGQSSEVTPAAAPAVVPISVPTEIARSQAA